MGLGFDLGEIEEKCWSNMVDGWYSIFCPAEKKKGHGVVELNKVPF